MDALNLTPEQLALLTEANTLFNKKRLAAQALELAARIARNILATASHCAALLESEPPTVAAYYASQQTQMASDLAMLTDAAKAEAITAAVVELGFTAEQFTLITSVMGWAINALLNAAEDGSDIAEITAAVQANYTAPVLIWD